MTTDQATRPVEGGQATPSIVQQAEAISQKEQGHWPRPRKGWTAIPYRVFVGSQNTKALRGPMLRIWWYVAERTLGQKGKVRGTGIRSATIARHLGLSLRVVKKALAELDRTGRIVREDPDRHGAPKFRLGDRYIERDDEGRFIRGFTKFPNQAWVWLPFLSDRAWRLLVALVHSSEPTAKKAHGARLRSTLVARSGLSSSVLSLASAELEYFGVLEVTARLVEPGVYDSEEAGWRPRKGQCFTTTIYDIAGLFSYPDFDRLQVDPLPNSGRGQALARFETPTCRTSLKVQNILDGHKNSLSGVPHDLPEPSRSARVLAGNAGKDNEVVNPNNTRNPPSHYTFEEYIDFVLGDNDFWPMVPTAREMDGDDNMKAWCPWCGGSNFSFSMTVHDEGGYGGGHCFNCADGVGSLAQYIARAADDSEPDLTHREIVRIIKKQAKKHPAPPDESFKLRVAGELAATTAARGWQPTKEESRESYVARGGRALPFRAWDLPASVPDDEKRKLAHIIDIYVRDTGDENENGLIMDGRFADVPPAWRFPHAEKNPHSHEYACDRGGWYGCDERDDPGYACPAPGCDPLAVESCCACVWGAQAEKKLALVLRRFKRRGWITLGRDTKDGHIIQEIDFDLLRQVAAKG